MTQMAQLKAALINESNALSKRVAEQNQQLEIRFATIVHLINNPANKPISTVERVKAALRIAPGSKIGQLVSSVGGSVTASAVYDTVKSMMARGMVTRTGMYHHYCYTLTET